MEDLITLEEAARRAGYRQSNNLRTAARVWLAWQSEGAQGPEQGLRTQTLGPRARMTTQAWLDAYLATLRPGNYKRGQQRKVQDPGDGAGEWGGMQTDHTVLASHEVATLLPPMEEADYREFVEDIRAHHLPRVWRAGHRDNADRCLPDSLWSCVRSAQVE